MTITIELTQEEETLLREQAELKGTDIETLAHDLLLQAQPLKLTNGRELLEYWQSKGVLGKLFMDRPEDAPELARKLREEASRDPRL